MVKYAGNQFGLESVNSLHDGYTINIKWYQAYPIDFNNKIAYHIYYSTDKNCIYSEGVKFVAVNNILEATLSIFEPGQLYYFAIKPVEYDPTVFDLENELPEYSENIRIYAESVLRSNITSTSLIIPLVDISDFPDSGIIKVGGEFINYLAKDNFNNDLHLASIAQRGYNSSFARAHDIDGYDGYKYWNTSVRLLSVGEDSSYNKIFMIEADFEYPNFPYTEEDGYKQVIKDLLHSDLSYSDEDNENFPPYDYSGWHRIDPLKLLTGDCVGSYQMGEKGCIDGYGNYNRVRGRDLQDVSNERLDVLLRLSGRPAVLLRRQHTGIVCSCYGNRREYQDDRCNFCYGTKFVMGYQQFYNPRSSDGRILVRVGPTPEKLVMQEAGMESIFDVDMWTLVTPIIKPRDIIILYDSDDNEDYRYEVSEVTRNNLLGEDLGAQKFRALRVRKTDTIYQIRVFSNTATMPSKLNTTISSSANGNIPPHSHQIVINENITNANQINQETSLVQGHSHPIQGGIVMSVLGHTHSIILP